MQGNFLQPPSMPPVKTVRKRIAGQDFEMVDVQWARNLVLSMQTWANGAHNSLQLNQVFRGPDLPSADTITVSYPLHFVNGNTTINNISPIATFSGGVVYLVNDGAWSLNTAGNISSVLTPPPNSLVALVFEPNTGIWFVPNGGTGIGQAIIGGVPNDVLYVAGDGTLGQDANFQWDTNALLLKKPLSLLSGADLLLAAGSLLTQYNGINTVLGGVPSILANADLAGQTAAIPATTLYAVPASGQGRYRVSYTATVTTAASVSSVLGGTNGFQVVFTNADGSVVVTTPAGPTSSLNTTQAYLSGSFIVYAKASTNIQYSFDYTSAGGTAMTYNLQVILEAL